VTRLGVYERTLFAHDGRTDERTAARRFPTRRTTRFGFARFTTKIISEGKSYFGQRGGPLDDRRLGCTPRGSVRARPAAIARVRDEWPDRTRRQRRSAQIFQTIRAHERKPSARRPSVPTVRFFVSVAEDVARSRENARGTAAARRHLGRETVADLGQSGRSDHDHSRASDRLIYFFLTVFAQLESCPDYDQRRQIRARLRQIMAEHKGKNGRSSTDSITNVVTSTVYRTPPPPPPPPPQPPGGGGAAIAPWIRAWITRYWKRG